ncbi:hypothetical protein VNI00_009938 [Paramarasmius palmivorus]|uniref:ubiquitinyl hydrolase 1 n=1 Tax=Paramarasmius palmivorus TaxID=297713 RepID=A0AAW0CNU4_9AGAR
MEDLEQLHYIVNHVFLPPKLPQECDESAENYSALCRTIFECARKYRRFIAEDEQPLWDTVVKMLEGLCTLETAEGFSQEEVQNQMLDLKCDDFLALLIRQQNAGMIIRRVGDRTIFESFEVSPTNEGVMSTQGKLICSYPGPAIAVPNNTARDPHFIFELSNFLTHMNTDVNKDAVPTTKKAGSEVTEIRDTTDPRFITELLTGILRGVGHPEEVVRISKRIADDVLWQNTLLPWRRAPIWLLIRVAIQTHLHRAIHNNQLYKSFIVFSMAKILRDGVSRKLDSDLLSCMRKKIARRLLKMGNDAPQFLAAEILEASCLTQGLLQERWDAEQARHATESLQGWDPESLDIYADTTLSLNNSRAYIERVLSNPSQTTPSSSYTPTEQPRFLNLELYSSGTLPQSIQDHGALALLDFEQAVERGLDAWISARLNDQSACKTLSTWIHQYAEEAMKIYDGNPESISIMYLTVFELWVGLDRVCVNQCPLLASYSPEVKDTLLEPLLLRKSRSMVRLEKIVEHIRLRHRGAIYHESIFSGLITYNSFVIRYYNDSPEHHHLKARIEQHARNEQRAKQEELRQLNQRHSELLRQANNHVHETYTNYWGKQRCSSSCIKCSLSRQARNMTIEVFEWPLPLDTLKANATVIELNCPLPFGIWRDTTYYVLRDLCLPASLRDETSEPEAEVCLRYYQALQPFIQSSQGRRIGFASSTKSFLNAHYRQDSIPSSEDRVCVNNGLTYNLYDTDASIWISSPFSRCTLWKRCTYHLPTGIYANLQYAVDGTSHTANEVIADQSDCHQDLTLHEYIAFASLRSGSAIQWHNMARELHSRHLTFRSAEVEMLISQAAFQIGPLSSSSLAEWEWHMELHVHDFGQMLLDELRNLGESVKSNWMEISSMRTVINLSCRLLSCAPTHGALAQKVLDLLRDMRLAVFQWMVDVGERTGTNNDEAATQKAQLRLCEMAATVRSTFDVEPIYHCQLLSSDADVMQFIVSGIHLRDNTPPYLKNTSPLFQQLLERDRRLSHAVAANLSQKADLKGLTNAIQSIWPAFFQRSEWELLLEPNDCWIHSRGNNGQEVHFNFLNSQLLVDGKPLSRLPSTFTTHSTYSRIFGSRILDVVPASGAQFAVRNYISDNEVLLSMISGELVVGTKYYGQQFELIPHYKLRQDLPTILVEDYAHWLNLSTRVIELRSLDNLWTPSATNSTIHFQDSFMKVQSVSGHGRLIDIRSRTARMIASRLGCLEHGQNMVMTHDTNNITIVQLPRYRLAFRLESRLLACQSLPGMFVDDNQSAGTLIGLRNQLVLRSSLDDDMREVLIPVGKVRFTRDEPRHTVVNIDIGTSRVRYYRYKIDSLLGRLVGNTDLYGRLYKVHLNAVTAFCLPDPLTGLTGTEQALLELQSSSCVSFQALDDGSLALLREIAQLTPTRVYYPLHLKVMQTVQWNCLPPTAQHDSFVKACQLITDFAVQLQVFDVSQSAAGFSTGHQSNLDLLNRAASRNFVHYRTQFQPIHHIDDAEYSSRDLMNSTMQGEHLVYKDAHLVMSWDSQLPTACNLWEMFGSWSDVSGPDKENTELSLSYIQSWMNGLPCDNWLTLYNLCRSKVLSRYQVLFTFCAMGYGPRGIQYRPLLPTLLGFATNQARFNISPPWWNGYNLSVGCEPNREQLQQTARDLSRQFDHTFAQDLSQHYSESGYEYDSRRRKQYNTLLDKEVSRAVNAVVSQWPCEDPSAARSSSYSLVRMYDFIDEVKPAFLGWYQNRDLCTFIAKVQMQLDAIRCSEGRSNSTATVYQFLPCLSSTRRCFSSDIDHRQLFLKNVPELVELPHSLSHLQSVSTKAHHGVARHESSALSSLFTDLEGPIRSRYAKNLHKSMDAFQNEPSQRLGPSTDAEVAVSQAGLWPCTTMRTLLQSIATANGGPDLSREWITVLHLLAKCVLLVQRSRRLLRLCLLQRYEELWKEMDTTISVVDSLKESDWLLIMIDNDFLVRPTQLAVADEMISPETSQNTVLQLNMGEGKSSVIVPMVTTKLADGDKLVRVVVLKPLAAQMFSLLVERLSSLTNRRIIYLPFSRDVRVNQTRIRTIQALYTEAMRSQAIIVSQPEHILSYQLMAVEHLLGTESHEDLARQLMESQLWLDENTRDVLDESDEILHVRYQLIYTMGTQQALENHPDRWTTVQQLLSLVRTCVQEVLDRYPQGIEIAPSDQRGAFPRLRILQSEAGNDLINTVTDHIISGDLDNCPFTLFSDVERCHLRQFLLDHLSSAEDIHQLKQRWHNALWKNLLLLRGLLGHGIIVYAFRDRRWRVDFGLDLRQDPPRTLLAVPYRAKDVPSLRAEFGHPDVAILLTCLSYYYGGLDCHQLRRCFELLYKLDNPKLEYETWAINANLTNFSDLSSINLQDSRQLEQQLFPLFQFNHATINFYLSQVVFPKAAKEFPEKLTMSGWDLARVKRHVTTGFSGTNDSQFILPTSIVQQNTQERLGTNAKVLAFLLQPENDSYIALQAVEGQPLSTRRIIDEICDMCDKVRVLLDVGAQILEMSNIEVVKYWLSQKPEVAAGIFFNDHDQLEVLTRDGSTEPLNLSPYLQQIGQCVVYLDDAHTRGTDLKLPANWKACVTLGPKVTKDRLVQGCMRMRKLGYGQSVVFMAPAEIDRAIRQYTRKREESRVSSEDVLRWAINETCNEIAHHVPHWVQQGVDYKDRSAAWASLTSADPRTALQPWLRPEARSLEEMYLDLTGNASDLNTRACSIPEIRDRCKDLGITSVTDPRVEEEQEREVSHEVEQEPQRQRPPKATAASHHVHQDVKKFIATGYIPPSSQVFSSLFSPLKDGTGALMSMPALRTKLFATNDFLTTIRTSSLGNGDYIRPVNWLVSGRDGVLVVLSPYEVNQLLPSIRESKNTNLHIYTPRTTQFMKSVDNLKFYCVPSLPQSWTAPSQTTIDLLNLAAGQLYFSAYEDYQRVCALLGVCTQEDQNKADVRPESDGFIPPENRVGWVREACLFEESPLSYLKVLTGFRRKGQTYSPTHLGKILHTRFLKQDDFKSD